MCVHWDLARVTLRAPSNPLHPVPMWDKLARGNAPRSNTDAGVLKA